VLSLVKPEPMVNDFDTALLFSIFSAMANQVWAHDNNQLEMVILPERLSAPSLSLLVLAFARYVICFQ
jgi:hypothetical protein